MSEGKKKKVIKVENLIIHADNVKIIDKSKERETPRRDPWDFFWGRSMEENTATEEEEAKHDSN